MMRLLLMAAMTVAGPALAPPPGITPIRHLVEDETARHVEVLRVRRDFGHPSVDVVLDAWMPPPSAAAAASRIDDLRIWWSDEVDRYPFSERTRAYVELTYDRRGPAHWQVGVASARGRSLGFNFDVRLHQGRPAAFVNVVLPGGRRVSDCRAHAATLHGRRLFGTVVGLGSMLVTCTDGSGRVHRGRVLRG